MNASATIGLTYYKIEVDGKDELELDKLNGIYKVHGRDVLSRIRSLC